MEFILEYMKATFRRWKMYLRVPTEGEAKFFDSKEGTLLS